MHRNFFSLLLVSIFALPGLFSQVALPRSTPEKEGVSSVAIKEFLDAVSASRNELHGFVFVRHGKIIADAWAKPYADSLKHTMYSTSKSFTSTAIGFAVAENKLTVKDKVISFFPELIPDTASEHLKALTVQNLLTMTVGHARDPSDLIPGREQWVKAFLATPVADTPGTKFLYNSMATFMLSAIVQKVTGQKVIDYLEPRLFLPLGITNKDWETNPEGINVGGWGLRIGTTDMAKLGLLYLQKGKWNGKQILPASWVEEASTAHIIQNPAATPEMRKSSDWLQGYGYQFWRSRNNSFRADGAFGQYILILPELDAVIAITSETPDMQDEMNLVWKHLLPAMKPSPLAQNNAATKALKQRIASLQIKAFRQAADTVATNISGQALKNKSVLLRKNENGFSALRFNTDEKGIIVEVDAREGKQILRFGKADWQYSNTDMKGPSLTTRAINSLEGLAPFKVAGKFRWKTDKILELLVQYVESPHHETWTCYFDDNDFRLEIRNSVATMKEDKIDETILGQ
jgi:CubicO group peptidase (beta-lactamase class C family)